MTKDKSENESLTSRANLYTELKKFVNKQCTVEDLSRVLSSIAVPHEFVSMVSEIEYQLEKVRFCVSDYEQYEEGIKAIAPLLAKINN